MRTNGQEKATEETLVAAVVMKEKYEPHMAEGLQPLCGSRQSEGSRVVQYNNTETCTQW